MDKIEYLAEKPETGFDFNSLRKTYCKANVKSQIIFYKIDNESRTIEIIRVLHQRMDIESKLGE
jgi:toxin ParE1/3/4